MIVFWLIAVVFAADPYLAEDIAELVIPEIEPLEPCLDPTGAIVSTRSGKWSARSW